MEQQTKLLQELMIEMKSIKSMLGGNSATATPKERYISPKEIMLRLGIGRSKLDEWANTGFIQKIKPDPNTKKVYFLHSDLNQKFPNVFPISA
jgi:hypothetical protein